MDALDDSHFRSKLVLEGAQIVAVRLDEALIIREVAGDWIDAPLGVDARDAVPALTGMEEELASADPDIHLPFVTLMTDSDMDGAAPIALSALRDPENGALWVLLRDASAEAEVQQKLVQQYNALSLAQRELARARDAALAADRAKTAFLANISHELRTPLNVVIGGAEILMKQRGAALSQAEIVDFSSDIRAGGLLLLRLVEDLIDLSRAETGDLTLYEEWCDPGATLREAARLIRATPDAEGLQIETEGAAPPFYGDPVRIKQIALNLLSNAVKASPPGGRVTASIARAADNGDLLIGVADEGPGMDDAQLAVALQPFGQPEAGMRARGAGLGLAIVSHLAALHGGALKIDTAPGAGLCAQVRLDAARFAPELD